MKNTIIFKFFFIFWKSLTNVLKPAEQVYKCISIGFGALKFPFFNV